VVEGQRQAPVPGVEDGGPPGVVGAPGLAGGPSQEDGRDRVEARVPGGVRIRAQLPDELDVERGLFAGFADRGRLEGLAVIDEATRQGPAGRRVPALDKDDAAAPPARQDFDDDVNGRERIAMLRASHRRLGLPGPL